MTKRRVRPPTLPPKLVKTINQLAESSTLTSRELIKFALKVRHPSMTQHDLEEILKIAVDHNRRGVPLNALRVMTPGAPRPIPVRYGQPWQALAKPHTRWEPAPPRVSPPTKSAHPGTMNHMKLKLHQLDTTHIGQTVTLHGITAPTRCRTGTLHQINHNNQHTRILINNHHYVLPNSTEISIHGHEINGQ